MADCEFQDSEVRNSSPSEALPQRSPVNKGREFIRRNSLRYSALRGLRSRDEERGLVKAAMRLSETALATVWENPDDTDYDRL